MSEGADGTLFGGTQVAEPLAGLPGSIEPALGFLDGRFGRGDLALHGIQLVLEGPLDILGRARARRLLGRPWRFDNRPRRS